MPPENLPSGAKKIYNAAEANAKKGTCKDSGDRMDECAARVAWAAVKKKYKKVGDKWMPKAELASFSMAITKTSYDKTTNTRRWNAVASDTNADLYNDSMTQELYSDFMNRIETSEQPPESFRSDFWSGGVPYLSISHYPDLNGKGVPGPVDVVYVDGEKLKASGRFDDTPIGKEVFQAISKDFSNNIPDDEKIRISIAFLDWMHKHKSNGFVFDRSKSEDPICPECLKELLSGESEGKEFLRGHLVHLALTRVPVNVRTSMELEERSMTTRKDDAASIIGEKLAEELDEEALLEGKSLASDGDPEIVIKAEEEIVEEGKHDYKDEEDDEEEEKKDKKMKEKKSEAEETPNASDQVLSLLEEIKSHFDEKPEPVHPLDIAFAELKSVYDDAVEMDVQEGLQMIQEPLEALAAVIQDGFVKEERAEATSESISIADAVREAVAPLAEELGLLRAEMTTFRSQPKDVLPDNAPPVRRSVTMPQAPFQIQEEVKPKSIREIVRSSVGLDN